MDPKYSFEYLNNAARNLALIVPNERVTYALMVNLIRDLNHVRTEYGIVVDEDLIKSSKMYDTLVECAITIYAYRDEDGGCVSNDDAEAFRQYLSHYILTRLDDFK